MGTVQYAQGHTPPSATLLAWLPDAPPTGIPTADSCHPRLDVGLLHRRTWASCPCCPPLRSRQHLMNCTNRVIPVKAYQEYSPGEETPQFGLTGLSAGSSISYWPSSWLPGPQPAPVGWRGRPAHEGDLRRVRQLFRKQDARPAAPVAPLVAAVHPHADSREFAMCLASRTPASYN